MLLLSPLISVPAQIVGALHGSPRELGTRETTVGSSNVTNVSNQDYYINVTLGGIPFEVLIDTGSSDLSVSGSVPNAHDTGKIGDVSYVVGGAKGPVQTTELELLGYLVPDQAFINQLASNMSLMGSGVIGLGPPSGSVVLSTLGSSTGKPALEQIFEQNKTTPNYLTVLLGRTDDQGGDSMGYLTIGETLPQYSNITSQPKLAITTVPSSDNGNQYWQTLLDADGVIGPTGESVKIQSAVSSTSNKEQLTVVFITGYSLPQVPAAIAEAFYGSVPGASLITDPTVNGKIWRVPCEYEVNVTFKFAGLSYRVNPLDTVVTANAIDDNGEKICYGAFQPSCAQTQEYDIIFGIAFLRNVYMLINFGDYVDGSTTNRAAPYIQLLSTSSDTAQMHDDYVSLRGALFWRPTPLPPNYSSGTPWVQRHLLLIISLSVVISLTLIGTTVVCLAKRRGSKTMGAPMRSMLIDQKYQTLDKYVPEQEDILPLLDPESMPQAWDSPR
ncbi:acid protease [Sparassis crispa]|uniref:Acid protease n=1 Tax=Sparassis crispa TaxID=139825 RepID=A0A401GLN2_9APHY|nr:acid protease [Sparassis crispa]GBE83085.1 acid protease [Sparassis crispa]